MSEATSQQTDTAEQASACLPTRPSHNSIFPPTRPPSWFSEILTALVERHDLTEQQVRCMIEKIINGRCDETETASLLIGLRMKGETATELATAASVLREHMVQVDTGGKEVLDTCGTGGDARGTFNISTAAALVSAAAGVAVVKHGNRAVSSRSGSADVLSALGVACDVDGAAIRRCLSAAGMAFCLAPVFHPALRRVAALRQRLGVRTIFNALGPLANPAQAPFQLLGVGWPNLLDPLAGAIAKLGTRRSILVCGRDGLDEVSLSAPTMVRDVRGASISVTEWIPDDFGLEPCSLADLRAADPQESANLILSVLRNENRPATRVVMANAAAALLAAGRVQTLKEGVVLAQDALASGRALQVLEKLAACSQKK